MKKQIFLPEFGNHLNYSVLGKGKPVMLLHGLCEDRKIWQYHGNILAENYRVIIPDLPGYGESAPFLDADFSLEKISDVLFFLADQAGMDSFAVVGHSMGGYTGLAMAQKHPERIQSLCLFHSTARADSEEKKKNRERAVKVFIQNRELFFRELFKNLFHTERLDEFIPQIHQLLQDSKKIEDNTLKGTLIALRDRKDRIEFLKTYPGHLSYFIGRHDNVLPAKGLIEEAELLDAHIHVSEQSGHMGFYESPQETAKYLSEFLEQTF
jgi:pimeloyl-ACP methyl ester carboxylesterase